MIVDLKLFTFDLLGSRTVLDASTSPYLISYFIPLAGLKKYVGLFDS